MSDGHFEAKKHAYRQTQDGIVVSFVVHPSALPKELALADLGTRFMVAFAEIGDDEKPKQAPVAQERQSSAGGTSKDSGATPDGCAKPKRAFKDLLLSQQAALRCKDVPFQQFMNMQSGKRHGQSVAQEHMTEYLAIEAVRHFCGVKTRADLDSHDGAASAWRELHREYESWLTTQQYADSVRR